MPSTFIPLYTMVSTMNAQDVIGQAVLGSQVVVTNTTEEEPCAKRKYRAGKETYKLKKSQGCGIDNVKINVLRMDKISCMREIGEVKHHVYVKCEFVPCDQVSLISFTVHYFYT